MCYCGGRLTSAADKMRGVSSGGGVRRKVVVAGYSSQMKNWLMASRKRRALLRIVVCDTLHAFPHPPKLNGAEVALDILSIVFSSPDACSRLSS